MKPFIPKEKLGKKARRQLDSAQRATWTFSPVTKKVESKKLYNRKRTAHDRYDDYGMGFCCGLVTAARNIGICKAVFPASVLESFNVRHARSRRTESAGLLRI